MSPVKTPEVGNTTITVEDFLKIWAKRTAALARIEVALKPAAEAIKQKDYQRQAVVTLWDSVELQPKKDGKYDIAFEFEYYTHGEMEHDSYSLPLEVALGGPDALKPYWEEEARKRQEEATRLGLLREARDKDKRRELYNKLKEEFADEKLIERT